MSLIGLHVERDLSMPEDTILRDLFDRWERVWHEGQYDLVPDASSPTTSGMTKQVTGP
jgi:hypothetical protein